MDTPEARMQAGKEFPGAAPDGMWEKEVRKGRMDERPERRRKKVR
ncbi:hypothetical protein RB298_15705 [Priestia sp. BR_2]